MNAVDFSFGLRRIKKMLLTRTPNTGSKVFKFFKIFTWSVWIPLSITLMLITGMTATLCISSEVCPGPCDTLIY